MTSSGLLCSYPTLYSSIVVVVVVVVVVGGIIRGIVRQTGLTIRAIMMKEVGGVARSYTVFRTVHQRHVDVYCYCCRGKKT